MYAYMWVHVSCLQVCVSVMIHRNGVLIPAFEFGVLDTTFAPFICCVSSMGPAFVYAFKCRCERVSKREIERLRVCITFQIRLEPTSQHVSMGPI